MLKMVKSFVTDEDGLEMVEWALVAALITTGAAAILNTIGGKVALALTGMDSEFP